MSQRPPRKRDPCKNHLLEGPSILFNLTIPNWIEPVSASSHSAHCLLPNRRFCAESALCTNFVGIVLERKRNQTLKDVPISSSRRSVIYLYFFVPESTRLQPSKLCHHVSTTSEMQNFTTGKRRRLAQKEGSALISRRLEDSQTFRNALSVLSANSAWRSWYPFCELLPQRAAQWALGRARASR